ncbi:polyphosphate kinase 1, partial [Coprococcus eutactus]|nr:polyphosphate kinase 1 [Coprococcus eutactus]
YIVLEELIVHYAPGLLKGYKVQEKTLMMITRNADIDVIKVYDEDLNYRDQMEQVVKLTKKLAPGRIEFTRDISQKMV